MCDTASITVNLARHVRSPDCRSGDLHSNRKGAITFVMAFMLIGLVAILALALDIGYLAVARTELQRSADAAAMASAGTLLDERRLKGEADLQELHAESRDAAQRYSALNDVCRSGPIVQRNEANDPDGDIVFGRFDGGETLSSSGSANLYNAVHVRVRCSTENGGQIPFFFGRALGFEGIDAKAEAIAMFRDGITGFRANKKTGNTSLIPFALHVDEWQNLLTSGGSDQWTYDEETGQVTPGGDGIPEMSFYPATQTAPGNFGTVEVGNPSNGTPDLIAQIENGMSEADLAYHGGELGLDPSTGQLLLNGDTGISGGLKAGLEAIVGKPRSLFLYESVAGVGDNAEYTIVGFAGIRIVDFQLGGPQDANGNTHYIIMQPSVVIDDAAVAGNGQSYSVYQPVVLVR